jgi:glycosyltransferase involved in cell wall biosynthesis
MKLLYIVPSTDRKGGLSASVNRITAQMTLLGNEVAVFSTGLSETKSSLLNTKDIFTGTQMMEITEKAIAEIKSFAPDLVVGYYGSSAAYCAVAAARFCDIKVVACLRGNDINRDFFSVLNAPKLSFVMQFANAVTCVSNEMKQKVKAWYNREAHFIANSVNKNIFYPDPEAAKNLKQEWQLDHRPVVGIFGEFKNSRGLSLFQELEKTLAPAQTIMVGEIRDDVKNTIPDWIIPIPYINDPDTLRAAYSMCDIILHPSLYDGMPNVVLEAMVCERVVLASDAGGIKDVITNNYNGFICTNIDEWKLALTNRLLYNNDDEIGKNARISIKTPEHEAKTFNELFLKITGKQELKLKENEA